MEEAMTSGPVATNEWNSLASVLFRMELMGKVEAFLPKRIFVPSLEHPLLVELKRRAEDVGVSRFTGLDIREDRVLCVLAKWKALNAGLTFDAPCFLKINEKFYLVE